MSNVARISVVSDVAAALAAYPVPKDADIEADVIAAMTTYGVDKWTKVFGSVTYAAGGIGTSTGSAVLYTPTASIELIRAVVAAGDPTVPLVGAGGATNLAMGVLASATVCVASVMSARTFAAWNAKLMGAGSDLSLAPADGYFLLAQADALYAGSPSRSLRVFTDAGTASGTINYMLERLVVL